MKFIRSLLGRLSLTAASFACSALIAQVEAPPPTAVPGGPGFGPGPGGPGGGRGPGGPGFGGPAQERKILSQFDKNGDKVLNAAERQSAREFLAANPVGRGRGGPPGGGRGRGAPLSPAEPGEHLTPADVKTYGQESLYDPTTLRTLFFTFEDADWEKEMDDFHRTDVDVPATLAVDGKTYRDVGLHFRGASSYSMVPAGRKRSLAVSVDMAHDEQTLLGYRTLNLLNSHEDASFLRAPLFSYIAQNYVPAPRMNFVRVVINGENWGIYANAEQFNKEFAKDRLGTAKGARWKVPGSPGGRGGLAYLGPDAAAYKGIYEIKSKDEPKSWTHFIEMCRVLNETPPDKLEAALSPLLDIDGALKFLALDIALVNGDGYWTRTSDYSIAEDSKGQLHVFPHDMNETFSFGSGFGPAGSRGRGGPPRGGPPQAGGAPGDPARGGPPAQGPGGPAGPGGGFGGPPGGGNNNTSGITLDPLIDGSNENTPLVTKLLAVPALRARYLGYVRDIASTWLDWSHLGPVAKNYHTLIDADVKRDTRKLETYEDFVPSVEEAPRSLKAFADQRRAFLLNYPEIKNLGASAGPAAK